MFDPISATLLFKFLKKFTLLTHSKLCPVHSATCCKRNQEPSLQSWPVAWTSSNKGSFTHGTYNLPWCRLAWLLLLDRTKFPSKLACVLTMRVLIETSTCFLAKPWCLVWLLQHRETHKTDPTSIIMRKRQLVNACCIIAGLPTFTKPGLASRMHFTTAKIVC